MLDSSIAVLIAIGIQIILLYWLSDASQILVRNRSIETRMSISFIQRPIKNSAVVMTAKSSPIKMTHSMPKARSTSKSLPVKGQKVESSDSSHAVGPSTTQALVLSLPADKGSGVSTNKFNSDPLANRGLSSQFEKKPTLHIRMQDSSIGGRLLRMQRAVICGDLRAALMKPGNGASAEAILESMKKQSCKI